MLPISHPVTAVHSRTPSQTPTRQVGIIGSRTLSPFLADKVGDITQYLIQKKYRIASGGAVGADQYCIQRLLHLGVCSSGVVFSPWSGYAGFPIQVQAMMRQFRNYHGLIQWGHCRSGSKSLVIKTALLERNVRLVSHCYGIVAFLSGPSNGTWFTIKHALKKRLTVVVFPFNEPLPQLPHIRWVKLRCSGCWEGGFKAVYS